MSTIFDWLANQPSVILLYANTLNRAGIVRRIITEEQFDGRPIVFMVENINEINQAVGFNVPDHFHLPYGSSSVLSQALKQESYIFVDNIALFTDVIYRKSPSGGPELAELIKTKSAKSKFIFLTTWSVALETIETIQRVISKIPILSFDLVESGIHIDYHAYSSMLSPYHSVVYTEHSVKERRSKKSNRMAKLAACNICYHQESSTEPSVLVQLMNYSPKIAQLLILILANSNVNRLIFSKFSNEYGLQYLSNVLTELAVEHVLLLQEELTLDEQATQINQLNQSNERKLILTNSMLNFPLYNIDVIDILEGLTLNEYLGLTRNILRKENYACKIIVYINFHVSWLNDGASSIDIDMYQLLSKQIKELSDYYALLTEHSHHIAYDNEKGLVVKVSDRKLQLDIPKTPELQIDKSNPVLI